MSILHKRSREPLERRPSAEDNVRSEQSRLSIPESVHEALSSEGQSLDTEARAFMEPRFGHDFSQVRIHRSERATRSALALGAQAYTLGSDIVFGQGAYAPETQDGRRLLAHELAHVVQAGNNDSAGDLYLGEPGDTYEQEAEREASHVMQKSSFAQVSEAPVSSLHTDAPGHVIRRSLLGGIIGGLAGAVVGAVGGFLVGGVAGAIIG